MGVVGSAAKTPPREVTNATRATTFTRHVFVEAFIWFGYRLDTKKKKNVRQTKQKVKKASGSREREGTHEGGGGEPVLKYPSRQGPHIRVNLRRMI